MSRGTALEQVKALVLDLREQHAFMRAKSLFIPNERLMAADGLLSKGEQLWATLLDEEKNNEAS